MPLADKDYEAIHVYEIELRERMVRVEEELKNQRELMKQGFDLMDKRFQEMRTDMLNRFEQVDKRFEQMDKRFETTQASMDKRFEQIDKRFEDLTKRIDRFMIWSFGLSVTMAGIIIGVLKLT